MRDSSKYYEVYRLIKADILSEIYAAGSFLPTEKELMERYHASRTTIRHAMAILKDEHVVRIRQGRGTQVSLHDKSQQEDFRLFHNVTGISNFFPFFGETRVNTQGCIVSVTLPPPEAIEALKIRPDTRVYRLERLFLVNGIPFCWQIDYLTCDGLPNLERFSGQIDKLHDLYDFLEQQYGILFSSGNETISATPAGFFDARLLEADVGVPLLEFVRTAVFTDGTREYTRLLARPDRIRLSVEMHGAPKKEKASRTL